MTLADRVGTDNYHNCFQRHNLGGVTIRSRHGSARLRQPTGLIGAASSVEVDGFKVMLEAEVPDRNHNFLLRFSLMAPEPETDEEN